MLTKGEGMLELSMVLMSNIFPTGHGLYQFAHIVALDTITCEKASFSLLLFQRRLENKGF